MGTGMKAASRMGAGMGMRMKGADGDGGVDKNGDWAKDGDWDGDGNWYGDGSGYANAAEVVIKRRQ